MVSQLFQVAENNPFIFSLIGCWIIISLIFISYLWKVKDVSKVNLYLYNSIPSVFTTLGVLGTFLGIYVGLQDFNVDEINKSIPTLLEGMKSAFATSILGIILSIIFKFLSQSVLKRAEKNGSNENELSALNQIVQELNKINNSLIGNTDTSLSTRLVKLKNSIEDNGREQTQLLNKVQSSLTGDEETSLLTQFANLRSQISDANRNQENTNEVLNNILSETQQTREEQNSNAQELKQKFNDFGEILKENNTKALVEVMQRVTESFNEQMSELINRLVQENFNELNQSVQNLNTWQQENKEMIGTLTQQFTRVSEDFAITSNLIQEITENTSRLTNENSHLTRLIQELQRVMIDDTRFTQITDNLTNTIETLRQNTEAFDETTNRLNEWVVNEKLFRDSVDVLISRLNEIDVRSIDLNNHFDNVSEQFTEQLNETLASLDRLIQRLAEHYTN